MTLQEAITVCKKRGYKIKNVETDSAVITKFGRSIILTIVISFFLLLLYIFPAVIYIIYVMKRRERIIIRANPDGDITAEPWGIENVKKEKEMARRWRAVGKVYFCLEQYEKAAESFERAISFSALDSQSLDYLAKCYEMGVMPEQAESAYQEIEHAKSIVVDRIAAWLVDVIPQTLLLIVRVIGKVDIQGSEPLAVIVGWLWVGHIVYFLIKDGLFGGRSIGKLICKLAVVDEKSGKACTIRQSFKRNLALLVPIAPLIAAVQIIAKVRIYRGKRIGEDWAGTKVIRHLDWKEEIINEIRKS